MEEIICFLEKWQRLIGPLIGALIGGIIGLLAALLVARDARNREEMAAAMILISGLTKVKNQWEVLSELFGSGVSIFEGRQLSTGTMKLVQDKPSLSPLFESSMARIRTVDYHLTLHLELFYEHFSISDRMLIKLEKSIDEYRRTGNVILSNEEIISYSKLAEENLKKATDYSKCAIYLLEKLILRDGPWRRLIKKIKAKFHKEGGTERKCRELIETGKTR